MATRCHQREGRGATCYTDNNMYVPANGTRKVGTCRYWVKTDITELKPKAKKKRTVYQQRGSKEPTNLPVFKAPS